MPTTAWKLPTASTVIAGSGTWTNPTNIQADDGTEATLSLAVKNTAGRWNEGQTFGLGADIPSGATITLVEIRVDWRVNSTGGIANLEVQAFVSGTGVGSVRVNSAEPTTLTTETFDITAERAWTRADLLDGTFTLRVRGRNGSSATDPSYRVDHVAVQVTYTETTRKGRITGLKGQTAPPGPERIGRISWLEAQATAEQQIVRPRPVPLNVTAHSDVWLLALAEPYPVPVRQGLYPATQDLVKTGGAVIGP